ncbi:MAG: hypothetical protein EBS30_00640 [Planctomycetes bacterium]|nr:hypothetical protein [Planctomycetota bacterium]
MTAPSIATATPNWLALHQATLTASKDGTSWLVHIGHELVYVLALLPVSGKHGIKLMQTINGRQFPVEGIFETPEAALAAGLEKLRTVLGW